MELQKKLALDFCNGVYDHEVDRYIWSSVFKYLIKNQDSLTPNRQEIRKRWIVSGGHLRDKVRNDELVSSVLRHYLPGYDGEGVVLYRGECRFLYDASKIGFCWSPNRETGELFGRGLNAPKPDGGVLLRGFAPPEAIFAGPSDYSWTAKEEVEYTCDPALIQDIEVIAEYPPA